MNLGDVQTFFANQLQSLGLREHDDGFNRENIPAYLLDQMFAIDIGVITSQPANQTLHVFSFPVTLRVYFKEYKNPNILRMQALAKAQSILNLLLKPQTRLNNGLKDIRPTTISVDPLSSSNDNSAILSLGFDVVLHFHFKGD